jgi:hypothetical protein
MALNDSDSANYRMTSQLNMKLVISTDNGIRVVNFVTSKNLTVKSTTFPHHNLHKYTWTSPHEKIYNQIDHILIDWRSHSSVFVVLSFSAAECDTGHYLVVVKVQDRLAVNKQGSHIPYGGIKSQEAKAVEGKEQYLVEVSNKFAALENLYAVVKITNA